MSSFEIEHITQIRGRKNQNFSETWLPELSCASDEAVSWLRQVWRGFP
jgi:hypothetical protein